MLEKYQLIENKIIPIKNLLEEKKDLTSYKGYYKGIITLQSPIINNPEILFIGINPGPGAYNELNQGPNKESNYTPLRMFNENKQHFERLSWFEKGNARGHFESKNNWKSYEWYQRDKKINNTFPKNMIDLLYEVARLKYPETSHSIDHKAIPFWFEDFGQQIMATNLYPVITKNTQDLKKIHGLLAKEESLKSYWEKILQKGEKNTEWVVRRYFISLIDELILLTKPRIIVCLGLTALNDFTYSHYKGDLVVTHKSLGELNIPIIGFSRKGQWSSRISEIAKVIVENQNS